MCLNVSATISPTEILARLYCGLSSGPCSLRSLKLDVHMEAIRWAHFSVPGEEGVAVSCSLMFHAGFILVLKLNLGPKIFETKQMKQSKVKMILKKIYCKEMIPSYHERIFSSDPEEMSQ